MIERLIDIIIPLSDAEKKDGIEIRFVLRAIAKNLTDYRDIYIVGKERNWLTGVKYISEPDTHSKALTIYQKGLAAASHPDVSDPFIFWADDCFLNRPMDVKDFKYWKSGSLQIMMAKAQGLYQRTVSTTYKYIKDKGWPLENFNIHVPIIYEKEKYLSMKDEDWTKEMVIKSLYCNKHGLKGEEMKDLVIRHPMRREEIRQAIDGRLFFSINEQGTNEAMKVILGELWPDPSKYELSHFKGIEANLPRLVTGIQDLNKPTHAVKDFSEKLPTSNYSIKPKP